MVGPLIRVDGTMDSNAYCRIMEAHLMPFMRLVNASYYQQDNAPCHSSKKTQDLFRDYNLPVIPWPPYSPDINPIENIWGYLKRKLRANNRLYRSSEELFTEAERIWYSIDSKYLKNLVASMKTRIALVKKSKGMPIGY
jgi:transposase